MFNSKGSSFRVISGGWVWKSLTGIRQKKRFNTISHRFAIGGYFGFVSDLNYLTGCSFDFISFEHDQYNSGDTFEKLSCDFLLNRGYKIGVKDVYSRNKKYKIYETWFINNDISFDEIIYENWKKIYYKKNLFKK